MGLLVLAQIERLRPDRIRVPGARIEIAHKLIEAVIVANPDRDVRLTIVRDGATVYTRDQKVSVSRTCQSCSGY